MATVHGHLQPHNFPVIPENDEVASCLNYDLLGGGTFVHTSLTSS